MSIAFLDLFFFVSSFNILISTRFTLKAISVRILFSIGTKKKNDGGEKSAKIKTDNKLKIIAPLDWKKRL